MKYTIYSKLPKIRPDIALMKHVHGEDEYLLMYDPLRYSRAPMILALHALRLLDCLQKDEDQTCEIIAETLELLIKKKEKSSRRLSPSLSSAEN